MSTTYPVPLTIGRGLRRACGVLGAPRLADALFSSPLLTRAAAEVFAVAAAVDPTVPCPACGGGCASPSGLFYLHAAACPIADHAARIEVTR